MVTEEHVDEQDPIAVRLRALAASAERDYGDKVLVSSTDGETMIAPSCGEGLPVGWWDPEDGRLLHIEVGSHRLSLSRTLDTVDYLADIVSAAVTGRISEVRSVQRKCLFIPRGDGSIAQEKGLGLPLGLIPLPGWTRRAKPVVYPAYGSLAD
jgi:hypothetical protein